LTGSIGDRRRRERPPGGPLVSTHSVLRRSDSHRYRPVLPCVQHAGVSGDQLIQQSSARPAEPQNAASRRLTIALAVISASQLMVVLDATIVTCRAVWEESSPRPFPGGGCSSSMFRLACSSRSWLRVYSPGQPGMRVPGSTSRAGLLKAGLAFLPFSIGIAATSQIVANARRAGSRVGCPQHGPAGRIAMTHHCANESVVATALAVAVAA
jgi:hypothetical protein